MVVLLRFLNEYDQDGGYYAGTFVSDDYAIAAIPTGHVGRENDEYEWFELYHVQMNMLVYP